MLLVKKIKILIFISLASKNPQCTENLSKEQTLMNEFRCIQICPIEPSSEIAEGCNQQQQQQPLDQQQQQQPLDQQQQQQPLDQQQHSNNP